MALDETLIEVKAAHREEIPNTIRFLQFYPPAVLVGYNQSIEQEVRVDFCKRAGIDINRRITGGGAILFDETQLGWEIICNRDFFNVGIATGSFFERLSRPLCQSLEKLGLNAMFRPRNDIEIDGKKISGTGGTELGDIFFFQGTLLVDFNIEMMLRALRIPIEKLKSREIEHARERVTCLQWELGRAPATSEIKRMLRESFEREFGITIRKGHLFAQERAHLAEKIKKFSSPEHIDKIREPGENQPVVRSLYKSKGGLIRTSLVINLKTRRLRSLVITGDFFAYPQRAIADLEAAMRDVSIDAHCIRERIERFFDSYRCEIPGVTRDDIACAILKSLEKTEVTRYGITIPESNHIFSINGSFGEIARKSPGSLLLPYCARSLDCGHRYEKVCPDCGECSAGKASMLGRAREMEISTIMSFEDLMATLQRFRSKGVSAYIGCCCEGFYRRHIADFESAGIPAILIDLDDTTCYELGREKDAYRGKFENQTMVKLELLEKVLDAAV